MTDVNNTMLYNNKMHYFFSLNKCSKFTHTDRINTEKIFNNKVTLNILTICLIVDLNTKQ